MRRLWFLALVVAVISAGVLAGAMPGCALAPAVFEPPELSDGYYSIVDESGHPIVSTGLGVVVGDEFVTTDNRVFVVVAVRDRVATARFERQEDLGPYLPASTVLLSAAAPPAVGIYHTHSDESYIPSDGTSAIDDRGGIYDVGAALARALQQAGLAVLHDEAVHLPHDAGAYARSRRTAANLLRQGANVLFDVHRDAGPAAEYSRTVDGTTVAQVMLVVGRQNPAMANNLAFAQALKAAADQRFPGLIRGILYAHGNYNQDLSPHSLLLEVGDDHSQKEDAEKGAAMLASLVPAVWNSPALWQTQERISWSVLFWLLMAVVLGGGTYLVIASGGVLQAATRLGHIWESLKTMIRGRRPA